MSFLDSDTILYIIIIMVFLAFFLWNGNRTKKNRELKRTGIFETGTTSVKERNKLQVLN
jgi:Flp pilus assembly protein TadB